MGRGETAKEHGMSTPSTPASSARPRASSAPAFNKFASRIAGSRFFPLYALLRHRGRKSGRIFTTPIVASRYGDGFIIPLAFGRETDWSKNLLAAGGGGLRWKSREYTLTAPEILSYAEGVKAFNAVARAFLPVFRPKEFAYLRITPESRP
jgi:deazaflavin-dependent oxidoreductase (nitroreductase family)